MEQQSWRCLISSLPWVQTKSQMNYETQIPVMPPMQVQGIAQLCTPHRVLCQFAVHSPPTLHKEIFYIFSVDNIYLFLPVFLWCGQGKDGFEILLDVLHLCREAIGNHYTASSALIWTFCVLRRFIFTLLPAHLQLSQKVRSHLTLLSVISRADICMQAQFHLLFLTVTRKK